MKQDILERLKNLDELLFYFWLLDMEQLGFLSDINYEKYTYVLAPKQIRTKLIRLKTKNKLENRTLLQPVTYTPDFTFKIEEKAYDTKLFDHIDLYENDKAMMSLNDFFAVDVKGEFAGKTNSTQYTFPIKQKVTYHLHKVFTNKMIPKKLINDTFVPSAVICAKETSSGSRVFTINGKKVYYKVQNNTKIKEWYENILSNS